MDEEGLLEGFEYFREMLMKCLVVKNKEKINAAGYGMQNCRHTLPYLQPYHVSFLPFASNAICIPLFLELPYKHFNCSIHLHLECIQHALEKLNCSFVKKSLFIRLCATSRQKQNGCLAWFPL